MNAARILEQIADLRVLVVGDICLDRWCWYEPSLAEASRETGIPRVAVVRTEVTPGAGGTVANNLAALGVRNVGVLGVVGEDGFGWELNAALNARGIDGDLLITSDEFCTFTYTKLLNSVTDEEDLPRVDFINARSLPSPAEERLLSQLETQLSFFDVVIVADQAETNAGGVITSPVRELIGVEAARHPEKVVWVDSRRRPELFRHVVLKPNEDEAAAACGRVFGATDHRRFFEHCHLRALIVTHGERGAEVVDASGVQWAETRKVQPVDICGAGDSFSAGAACALSVTGSPLEAAQFGNLVASITVTKKGTGTASPEEVLASAEQTVRV